MFDVGFAELFLLALIGLLVLGPERLPKAARTLGGMVRKARTSWFALRRTIEAELNAAEISESVKSVGKDIEEISRKLDEVQNKVPEVAQAGKKGAAEKSDGKRANGE
jgi:sec-independent protein translocase protein TatB